MPSTGILTAATDAGLLALWSTADFTGIDDYLAWEERVMEPLPELIAAGQLVPINIGSDGAFTVRMALAPDGLLPRELNCLELTSEPYLLQCTGGELCLSGFEHVGNPGDAAARVPLAEGRYAVEISMISWTKEPGMVLADGSAAPGALVDFVVVISPAAGDELFRQDPETFDHP